MKQHIALGMAVILCGVAPVLASSIGGTSGGEILSIPVGARAIGMGEAYTAMADDVSSLYWNPAGLAILNQSQASFMYNQWLKDLTFSNGSLAVPLENGGIGASLSYLSYGTIDAFDSQGNPAGTVNAYSGVATVGGAWLGDIWSAGFNLKGIQGQLADVKATGFATDLGATLVYPKEFMGGTLRGAATVRNLGPGLKYIDQSDPLPEEWRIGLAAVQMMNQKLNLSMDYGQQRDLDGSIYMGAEYLPIPNIALRAGYAGSHTESSGIRAGLGLKIKDLSFDYAFSPYGDLGMTQRYELTMRFGAPRPILTPEMRRMLRQAKVAMADGRFGEATMLLDSLIRMEPRYKPFHRLIKTAMGGYEKQEDSAKNQKNVDLSLLQGKKPTKEDNYETQDLESLLKMSDDAGANANAGNLIPASGGKSR
jgi:uncharacterized protein UPF0164